jgi:hypothetical protein
MIAQGTKTSFVGRYSGWSILIRNPNYDTWETPVRKQITLVL